MRDALRFSHKILPWKYFSVTDGGRCEAKLTRTLKFTEKPITQVLSSISVPEPSFTPLSPPYTLVASSYSCPSSHPCHLLLSLSPPHTLVTSSYPCHLASLSPHHYSCHLMLVTTSYPCHFLMLVTSSYPCHSSHFCHLLIPLSLLTPLSPPHTLVTPHTFVTSTYPCHLLTSLSPPQTLVTSHPGHLLPPPSSHPPALCGPRAQAVHSFGRWGAVLC